MHGNFGLQLVGQHPQYLGVTEALLVGPQIVEPFDDTHFQLCMEVGRLFVKIPHLFANTP